MAHAAEPNHRPNDWMRASPVEGLGALVAGAGSGIGAAAAQVLAANGASVVVSDRRSDAAERVASEIVHRGGRALAIRMDVTRQADIDAAITTAVNQYGQLDILINSAGVILPAALEDCSLNDWRTSFLVNVDAARLLGRSCMPHLRKSRVASFINVAALAGGRAYPNGGAYGPSKAALISLTRQMALEWDKDGIRVNVVSPGTIDTPLTRANMTPSVVADREARIPLGRLGTPGELADLIVFLASPAASFVTAQEVNCDGGLSQSLLAQKFHANK
jgi:NAD(P)-dependent dehydrogenase (short-subunit alcohol dehydrogenase family)